MARRSFGGYLCHETLSSGLFGEVFRATNDAGKEARVVVVDPRLGLRKNFSQALARHGAHLGDLVHPHVISTYKVGRGRDDSLVVIESSVERPHDLRSVLDGRGPMPMEIALSVVMGALRGLSYAHDIGICHGGIHPRSVVIDSRGITKVADFALARALTVAAADSDDTELLAGLRGYVAPELALGSEPSIVSDVYAMGALISHLLWGVPAPPSHEDSALAAVVRAAVDTDPDKRLLNASELESHMRRAIEESGLMVATAAEVSQYIHGVESPHDAGLDAETEDLLSALSREETREDTMASALDEALAGLEDSVEDVDTPVDTTEGAPYVGDMTHADLPRFEPVSSEDKVDRLLREAPSKQAFGRRIETLGADDDYVDVDETPLPVPRPFHADGTHVGEFVDLVGRQAATSAPFDDSLDLPALPTQKKRGFLYLLIIVFILSGVFAALYTQTDLLRAAAEEEQAEKEAKEAELREALPDPGEIAISSETEDAAVWLFLGKTPVRSMALPASMVHELRIEHEGYQPLFLSVAAQQWGGSEEDRKAYLNAELVAASAEEAIELPAFPPEHNPPLAPGGGGTGPIEVDTVPAGAEVWLWVGTTPQMQLGGIEAGKDYRFKVLKEGFVPAALEIAAKEWFLSGTAEGPKHASLSRSVVLTPEEPSKRPRKSRRKRRK